MAKKEFIDTKLIATMTAEVLLKVIERQGVTIQEVANKLPQDYSFVWRKLKSDK